MKRFVFFSILFLGFSLLTFVGCKNIAAPETGRVVIWTYDTFTSEWGPGPEIAKRFLAKTGLEIEWVNHGDAGELLAKLLLEGEGADVILGLDQNLAERALASGLFESYKSENYAAIFPHLVIDPSYSLVPFDYSYFSICYDSEKVKTPPASLEDLTKAEFSGKLILLDPRTSSPGLGFLAWTQAVYGAAWQDYWKRLSPSILTIAEGWSSGYGLFTAGEAPLVLSYTTSPGYHLEYEDEERYRAAVFAAGHPVQIELAGILKNAPNPPGARRFLDFLAGADFQETIPLGNWMYPVIDLPLPASFLLCPKPAVTLNPKAPTQDDLNEWVKIVSQK
jgi:thiamine transport system substrate-binding protein